MHIPSSAKKIAALASTLFIALIFFSARPVNAQSATPPQFFISWKAVGSYVPSAYTGKPLPSYNSEIVASLELVSQGKIINISDQTIYWYLNGTLIGGGTGVQQVTFPPFGTPPNSLDLEIDLPTYNGEYLTHSITIPMAAPMVVLYAPFPNNQFSSNPLTITSLPYFFDISDPSDLSYTWAVNGQTGTNNENPENAQVSLPQGTTAGTTIDTTLSVKNPLNSTVATAEKDLTYEPLP